MLSPSRGPGTSRQAHSCPVPILPTWRQTPRTRRATGGLRYTSACCDSAHLPSPSPLPFLNPLITGPARHRQNWRGSGWLFSAATESEAAGPIVCDVLDLVAAIHEPNNSLAILNPSDAEIRLACSAGRELAEEYIEKEAKHDISPLCARIVNSPGSRNARIPQGFFDEKVINHLPLIASCELTAFAQTFTETFNGYQVIAGQVILKPQSASPALIGLLQTLLDSDSVRQLGGSGGPYLFHSRSQSAAAMLVTLALRNDLAYAEPDYILHTTTVPNDPDFSSLYALKNFTTPGADISAVPAWDISTGSTQTVVGVIISASTTRIPTWRKRVERRRLPSQ